MATFLEVTTWSQEPLFQNRVKAAMVKVALQISGEAIGEMTPIWTLKRQQMASAVVSGLFNAGPWALAVMTNATVQGAGVAGDPPTSSTSDGDIEFVVTSIWDDMSGVTTEDKEAIEEEPE